MRPERARRFDVIAQSRKRLRERGMVAARLRRFTANSSGGVV